MAIAGSNMSKMRLNRVFSRDGKRSARGKGVKIVIQKTERVQVQQERESRIYYNIIYTIIYLFHFGHINNHRTDGSTLRIYDRQGDMLRISKQERDKDREKGYGGWGMGIKKGSCC